MIAGNPVLCRHVSAFFRDGKAFLIPKHPRPLDRPVADSRKLRFKRMLEVTLLRIRATETMRERKNDQTVPQSVGPVNELRQGVCRKHDPCRRPRFSRRLILPFHRDFRAVGHQLERLFTFRNAALFAGYGELLNEIEFVFRQKNTRKFILQIPERQTAAVVAPHKFPEDMCGGRFPVASLSDPEKAGIQTRLAGKNIPEEHLKSPPHFIRIEGCVQIFLPQRTLCNRIKRIGDSVTAEKSGSVREEFGRGIRIFDQRFQIQDSVLETHPAIRVFALRQPAGHPVF